MNALLNNAELQELMHDLGEAYVVGGSVRDAMCGVVPADVDLATPLNPQEVREALQGKYRMIPTGVEHGTWTIVGADNSYEVTSFRKDVATDGRRAVVEFSRNIEDDAYRRDFTFNALYMAADGKVIDPTLTGEMDLRRHHVRFVGSAFARCREDYLRILRYFRFRARFGGSMFRDAEAFDAVSMLWPEVFQKVSVERVGSEMHKIMSLANPLTAIIEMDEVGMLQKVFGKATRSSFDFERLLHNEYKTLPGRVFERRVAFMTPDIPVWIKDKAAARNISHIRTASKEQDPAKVAFRYRDMAVAVDAHVLQATDAWEIPRSDAALRQRAEHGLHAQLPVDGDVLLSWGIPAGTKIGAALKVATEVFEDSNFEATPERIRESVLEWARKTNTPLALLA
jgi:poly(A) polymerase